MLERIELETDSEFELLIDYAALLGTGDLLRLGGKSRPSHRHR